MKPLLTASVALLLWVCGWAIAAERSKAEPAGAKRLYEIRADLVVPPVIQAAPAAGKRVRTTTPGWENTSVYHALYLPGDWKAEGRFPVIVEYPGNGGYRRDSDVSQGTPDGCSLGYGLSGGEGAIWVCLPFVDTQNHFKQNTTAWWGDVEETKRYCLATVEDICRRFGGDSKRVILAGFSRGAIAGNFIGLHDQRIAALWCGFFCHSHYDGVRKWGYEGSDRASALERLARLGDRPQWISQEMSTAETERYLGETGVKGKFTFVPLPFPNHTDQWVLRDLPIRKAARAWYQSVVR